MTLSLKQQMFAVNVAKLILRINEAGYSCTLGEAWRTPEMAEIYAKRGTGIKRSLHCDRLAIDLNLFKDGVYLPQSEAHKPFGEFWCSLNAMNRWGGDFTKPDGNHYSMSDDGVRG